MPNNLFTITLDKMPKCTHKVIAHQNYLRIKNCTSKGKHKLIVNLFKIFPQWPWKSIGFYLIQCQRRMKTVIIINFMIFFKSCPQAYTRTDTLTLATLHVYPLLAQYMFLNFVWGTQHVITFILQYLDVRSYTPTVPFANA